MSSLKVSVNVSGLAAGATKAVYAGVLPRLSQAVAAVAAQTQQNWQEGVLRAKLWSGERDAYAASITWNMTGPFSAYVSTDYKLAEQIETGRPARDLKKMLDTSQKVRRTKDGRRFLVIPFRHTLNSMPAPVRSMAKGLDASSITAQGLRPAGEVTNLSPKSGMHAAAKQSPYLSSPKTQSAAMVAKRSYQWGGRLMPGAMKAAEVGAADRKRFAGMVRMNTSTPGGAKSSAYMTFRIMIEGSSGWIVPAQPGQYIAKKVADDMQPKAASAFAEAVKRSL
jgi:hypothetical protein